MSDELSFSFRCKIDADVGDVFNAITDPAKISRYFTDGASEPMAAGKTVMWRFGDFELDVQVEELVENERLVCNWPASNSVGYRTQFTFEFEAVGGSATAIAVSERGWKNDQAGIDSAMGQCSGWTHFFASLKSYLEHGTPMKAFYLEHAAEAA